VNRALIPSEFEGGIDIFFNLPVTPAFASEVAKIFVTGGRHFYALLERGISGQRKIMSPIEPLVK